VSFLHSSTCSFRVLQNAAFYSAALCCASAAMMRPGTRTCFHSWTFSSRQPTPQKSVTCVRVIDWGLPSQSHALSQYHFSRERGACMRRVREWLRIKTPRWGKCYQGLAGYLGKLSLEVLHASRSSKTQSLPCGQCRSLRL